MTATIIPAQFDLDSIGNGMPNTELSYLYRDGANYKQDNTVVLSGAITMDDVLAITKALNEDEMFIPSGVGLPDLQKDWDDELDHPFHQITGVGPTDADPTITMTLSELVARLSAADWEKEQMRVTVERS